ncbi:hypothetical protein LEMLEM_LOCUS12120, partial [Lemmus lemmus]
GEAASASLPTSSLALLLSLSFLSSLSLSLSLLFSPSPFPLHNPLNKYPTSLCMACLSMSVSLAYPPCVSCLGPATAQDQQPSLPGTGCSQGPLPATLLFLPPGTSHRSGPAAVSAWDWLLSGPATCRHMAPLPRLWGLQHFCCLLTAAGDPAAFLIFPLHLVQLKGSYNKMERNGKRI